MSRIAYFADLMTTLFERRPAKPDVASRAPIAELCAALLSSRGEVSGAAGAPLTDSAETQRHPAEKTGAEPEEK